MPIFLKIPPSDLFQLRNVITCHISIKTPHNGFAIHVATHSPEKLLNIPCFGTFVPFYCPPKKKSPSPTLSAARTPQQLSTEPLYPSHRAIRFCRLSPSPVPREKHTEKNRCLVHKSTRKVFPRNIHPLFAALPLPPPPVAGRRRHRQRTFSFFVPAVVLCKLSRLPRSPPPVHDL